MFGIYLELMEHCGAK